MHREIATVSAEMTIVSAEIYQVIECTIRARSVEATKIREKIGANDTENRSVRVIKRAGIKDEMATPIETEIDIIEAGEIAGADLLADSGQKSTRLSFNLAYLH